MSTTRPALTHAGINCRDLERMRAFYCDVIGLIETDRGKSISFPVDLIFLSSDPKIHHQLALASGRPPDGASTINQLSFVVQSLDELKEMYERVKRAGVQNVRPVNHGCAWSMYFPDPEGNIVEIYLDTPWYINQPHADPLDLALPTNEIIRRTREACEKDPTYIPATQWQEKMRAKLTGGSSSTQ
jgi:catechol 2,3-dioxygenase